MDGMVLPLSSAFNSSRAMRAASILSSKLMILFEAAGRFRYNLHSPGA
jgi:hypothetical protein